MLITPVIKIGIFEWNWFLSPVWASQMLFFFYTSSFNFLQSRRAYLIVMLHFIIPFFAYFCRKKLFFLSPVWKLQLRGIVVFLLAIISNVNVLNETLAPSLWVWWLWGCSSEFSRDSMICVQFASYACLVGVRPRVIFLPDWGHITFSMYFWI